MHELDWGGVTPEGASIERNVFTYVFNHKLSSNEEIDRTIRFIAGRLLFYDKHLPPNPTHIVKIDARGQNIDHDIVTHICQKVREKYNKPNLQEVNVIQ